MLAPTRALVSQSGADLSGRSAWAAATRRDRHERNLSRPPAPAEGNSRDRSRTPPGDSVAAAVALAVNRTGIPLAPGSNYQINISARPITSSGDTANLFRPGWKIGAFFSCIDRPGLAHRIYEGPPDGTPRVRLGPDAVPVDFSRPYQIKAMFANEVFSAVQFNVPQTHADGSTSNVKVWKNVCRRNDRWAEIIDSGASWGLGNDFPGPDDADSSPPAQITSAGSRSSSARTR